MVSVNFSISIMLNTRRKKQSRKLDCCFHRKSRWMSSSHIICRLRISTKLSVWWEKENVWDVSFTCQSSWDSMYGAVKFGWINMEANMIFSSVFDAYLPWYVFTCKDRDLLILKWKLLPRHYFWIFDMTITHHCSFLSQLPPSLSLPLFLPCNCVHIISFEIHFLF